MLRTVAGRAVLIAAVVMASFVGAAHGESGQTDTNQSAFGPIGTISAPHGAGIQLTNVQTGAEQAIAVMPPVGVAGHTAWSPDRSQIAISRFGRRPGERIGGSDILVVPAEGGDARLVAEHDVDGALLGAPAWLPDGSALLFDHLPPSGGALQSQVMLAPVFGGGETRAIATGGWPAISPDGRLLAYVRSTRQDGFLNELVLADFNGVSERVLVPADQLVQITSPRFSPDGSEIAYIGSVSRGEALGAPSRADDAFGSLGPGVFLKGVMNHGPPGDVWVISRSGGQSSRLTWFDEDEPTLAWSPDGYWLAMLGGGGLYLLPRDVSAPPRMVAKGGFGGIDWR